MDAPHSLDRLETLDGYRQEFMDAALWRPFVSGVCRENGWSCSQVRPGLAGTFPTFIVDESRVVKFFGPLFGGGTCLKVEREMAGAMAGVPEVPIARLLAEGALDEDLRWGYLVFEFFPGASLGEGYDQIPLEDKLKLACHVGAWAQRLHQVQIPGRTALPRLSLERMQGWFEARWPEEQKKWPTHLAGEVPEYLEKNAGVVQSGACHFIHADLTQDHLLGEFVDGHWQTRALIDFGDAMLGNLYYELAALHLDLFDCDRRLLAAFLDEYGFSPDPDFPRKAMTTSLLHQFDVYGHLFTCKPELRAAVSLDALTNELWHLDP